MFCLFVLERSRKILLCCCKSSLKRSKISILVRNFDKTNTKCTLHMIFKRNGCMLTFCRYGRSSTSSQPMTSRRVASTSYQEWAGLCSRLSTASEECASARCSSNSTSPRRLPAVRRCGCGASNISAPTWRSILTRRKWSSPSIRSFPRRLLSCDVTTARRKRNSPSVRRLIPELFLTYYYLGYVCRIVPEKLKLLICIENLITLS